MLLNEFNIFIHHRESFLKDAINEAQLVQKMFAALTNISLTTL